MNQYPESLGQTWNDTLDGLKKNLTRHKRSPLPELKKEIKAKCKLNEKTEECTRLMNEFKMLQERLDNDVKELFNDVRLKRKIGNGTNPSEIPTENGTYFTTEFSSKKNSHIDENFTEKPETGSRSSDIKKDGFVQSIRNEEGVRVINSGDAHFTSPKTSFDENNQIPVTSENMKSASRVVMASGMSGMPVSPMCYYGNPNQFVQPAPPYPGGIVFPLSTPDIPNVNSHGLSPRSNDVAGFGTRNGMFYPMQPYPYQMQPFGMGAYGAASPSFAR